MNLEHEEKNLAFGQKVINSQNPNRAIFYISGSTSLWEIKLHRKKRGKIDCLLKFVYGYKSSIFFIWFLYKRNICIGKYVQYLFRRFGDIYYDGTLFWDRIDKTKDFLYFNKT